MIIRRTKTAGTRVQSDGLSPDPGASSEAERRFHRAAAPFDADPHVQAGTGFGGAPGRRVDGRISAMLMHGALVVKLPADRVSELIGSGTAQPFDAGKGRPMREWASVPATDPDEWPALIAEAHAFVRGASG
jgi:hypothetical protein